MTYRHGEQQVSLWSEEDGLYYDAIEFDGGHVLLATSCAAAPGSGYAVAADEGGKLALALQACPSYEDGFGGRGCRFVCVIGRAWGGFPVGEFDDDILGDLCKCQCDRCMV